MALTISMIPFQPIRVHAQEQEVQRNSVVDPLEYDNNEIIVKFKEDTSVKQEQRSLSALSVKDVDKSIEDFIVVETKDKDSLKETIKDLTKDENVDYIQPNYEYELMDSVVDDKYFNKQWALYNDGSFSFFNNSTYTSIKAVKGIDINIVKAWELLEDFKPEKTIKVAVVDTGIDYSHEDLKDQIWKNTKEIAGDGIDNDKNGYIDDVYGWNFYDNNNKIYNIKDYSYKTDEYYDDHGTHCAGTIAANKNNKIGVSGIASDLNVKVMSVKALGGIEGMDRNKGTTSSVTQAIKYAQKMGADICNLSVGGNGKDRMLEDVMKKSDMLFVCAAGNDGKNNDRVPVYPASFNLDNIISVANIVCDGTLAKSSNYGAISVDIGAPGSNIASTGVNDSYLTATGTSMAAPMVSGAAAMLYAYYDGISAKDAKKLLISSAKPLTSLKGKVATGGMLDVYGALTQEATPPKITLTTAKKENGVEVKAKVSSATSLKVTKLLWESGKQTAKYFKKGTVGQKIENDTFLVNQSGTYTVYALDSAGNETVVTINITVGTPPKILGSTTPIENSNSKTLKVQITDSDNDLLVARFIKGSYKAEDFANQEFGEELMLINGEASFVIDTTSTYTFYTKDKAGNVTLKKITVTIPLEPTISLTKSSITMDKGSSTTLKPVLSSNKATATFTYKSSDDKVASVSNKGKITAKKKGTVVITISTKDGQKKNCKVKVS